MNKGAVRFGIAWIALIIPSLIYTFKSGASLFHLFGFLESDNETTWSEYLVPPVLLVTTFCLAGSYSVIIDWDLPKGCKMILRTLIYGGALSMTLWLIL